MDINVNYNSKNIDNVSNSTFNTSNNTQIDEPNRIDERYLKRTGQVECSTCKSRKYVDGSDDSGVSYQTPTNISPLQSASKVTSHEREHFTREQADADRNDATVLSNTITVSHAVCSECGTPYVSGGKTTTVKRYSIEKENDKKYFNQQYFENSIGKHLAKDIDKKA